MYGSRMERDMSLRLREMMVLAVRGIESICEWFLASIDFFFNLHKI